MNDTVVTGVLTLGGVVVGGLLNGGVTYVFARRRDKQTTKAVARLVVRELEEIERQLLGAQAAKHWRALAEWDLARWETYEPQLAAALSDEDWNALRVVYTSVELFENEATFNEPGDPLYPDDLAHAEMTLKVVQDALERLRSVAGEPDDETLETVGSPVYERYLSEAEARWLAAVGEGVEPEDEHDAEREDH